MQIPIIRLETRKIQDKLKEMVTLVTQQHQEMGRALKKSDKKKAFQVLKDDSLVNAKFDEITADLEFLITKTPLDKDLRRTMAYIMIAQDLERIGDYVKYIGKFITKSDHLSISLIQRINKIHLPFIRMLKGLIIIIHQEKYQEAMALAKKDRYIDKLTDKLQTDLISSIANHKNADEIADRVFVLNIIAGIERAADHITHICELIGYIYTGKHVDLE